MIRFVDVNLHNNEVAKTRIILRHRPNSSQLRNINLSQLPPKNVNVTYNYFSKKVIFI